MERCQRIFNGKKIFMKRLGIFVFYDKEGVVDRYVEYLLNDIIQSLSELIIVCNGNLSDDGRHKLEHFTQRIFVRENLGFDAMAYKMALGTYCSWDEIEKFEEVVLFNDTFFGPLYPFKEMFNEMSSRSLDFWGITSSKEMAFIRSNSSTRKIFPTHIQYYFVVISKKLSNSDCFQEYWNTFDSTNMTFSDVIIQNEMRFTQYFSDRGFKWGTYVDSSEYESENPENNFNHYGSIAYELIKDFRCPIMKRKNFITKELSTRTGNAGEDCAKALSFIDQHTNYNVELIWENILRVYPIGEIKDALHLDYIVSTRKVEDIDSRLNCIRVAIIAVVDSQRSLNMLEEKWLGLPDQYKKIVLCTIPIKTKLHDVKCYHLKNKSSFSDLIQPCLDVISSTDFFCFLNGCVDSSVNGPATVMQTSWNNTLSALVSNVNYIENVLDLFLKNKRMGLLTLPPPLHGPYFGSLSSDGYGNFNEIKRLGDEMKLNVPISEANPNRFYAKSFWCRSLAINDILSLCRRNNVTSTAVESLIPLAVQNQGFYSGIVLSDELSSLMINNLYYMLSGIIGFQKKRVVITDYPSYFTSSLSDFCQNKNKIFVYGAGLYGERIAETLIANGISFDGFVVSDGQPNPKKMLGKIVYYLSEICAFSNDCGIVVAMMARSRSQVIPLLNEKGFDYIVV